MAKKGTLNYYKEYIILGDGDTEKARYSDLFMIHNTDPMHLEAERYAVLLKKNPKDCHDSGRWAIIDEKCNYITPAKYLEIDKNITRNDNVYTIFVSCDDGKYNLVKVNGREVFAKNYFDIDNSNPNSAICILRDEDHNFGLGNLKTAEVVLQPKYVKIERLKNDELFMVYERGEDNWFWGLADSSGGILCKPQYTMHVAGEYWNDYNIAVGVRDRVSGLYHHAILDWNGVKVYETDAKECRLYPLNQVGNYDASFGAKAVNAFIFLDNRTIFNRGSGRLVVLEYDEPGDRDYIYEAKFMYSLDYSLRQMCSLYHDTAKKSGLTDKIYY